MILVLLVSLFSATDTYSQSRKKKKADKIYAKGEYHKAIKYYKKALKKNKDRTEKVEINFLLGECSRKINRMKKVTSYYNKAAKKYPDPIVLFRLANSYKKKARYEDALETYKKYLELVPLDSIGQEAIESFHIIKEWTEHPTNYIVENMKDINSKQQDFCPGYDARKDYNDIYFTSTRKTCTGKKINDITGDKFTDLFVIKKNRKLEWEDPEPLDTLVNTIFDEGCPSLTPDSKRMYYTECKIERNKRVGCKIFTSTKNGGEWSIGEFLQIVKDTAISIAHPAINTDETILYYTSDMKGGFGGKDIWRSIKKDGNWSTPRNLGPDINTAGDEMFPYVREDGVLFFSSDRLPSLGGLDIFKATPDEKGKNWTVENMKSPINSAGDDFGIVFQGVKEKGLLTSNRKGGRGEDDIYSFEIPPIHFSITGKIQNEDSTLVLDSSIVRIFGSDGSAFNDTTNKEGEFNFQLKKNTDYVYAVYKKGFFNTKGKVSTYGYEISKDFDTLLCMKAMDKPIELPNIVFDFASATLKEKSKEALKGLVSTMVDNANIVVELSSHSDMVGTDEINMTMSQKRAQSVVNYLVENKIDKDRLVPKGYGETKPRKVSKNLAKKYDFLRKGNVLNETFILSLTEEQQEICNQLNRRTEFVVLSTDFISKSMKKQIESDKKDKANEKSKKKRKGRRNKRY